MASGLGQQRAVIAVGKITVAAAKIDDADALMRLTLLGRKIGFKGDDLVAGIIGIPVGKIINNQKGTRHNNKIL
jgi:hypothetical protein